MPRSYPKTILTILISASLPAGVSAEENVNNPLLTEFNTPFGVPPFDAIRTTHYDPAFQQGIKDQLAEVAAIASSTEAPTFGNTIEALERMFNSEREALSIAENMEYLSQGGNRLNPGQLQGSLYLQGRAHEALGETSEAAASYERLLDMAGEGIRQIVGMQDVPERLAATRSAAGT